MKPQIVITHARFDEHRHQSLHDLTAQLRTEAPDIPFHIVCDDERMGSRWCWRQAMDLALLDPEVTHIVWLPDDVKLCQDYGRILKACIEARPNDVFDGYCGKNYTDEWDLAPLWYETRDGYTGLSGVMPRKALLEHLKWLEDTKLPATVSPDGGICLWAISTGRWLYKTAFSLVRHDPSIPSLCGHDEQNDGRVGYRFIDEIRHGVLCDIGNLLGRTYDAPPKSGVKLSTARVAKTYENNHWDMVRHVPPEHWNLDAMYQVECPVSERERVVVIVPKYGVMEDVMTRTRPSREAVQDDLMTHGVECVIIEIPGDSHVDRMRQRATHEALKRGCTHLLWWDADIEALDAKCVRRMLMMQHDIIAGACPFKNTTGHVVCNPWPEMLATGTLTIEGGCLEVQDAGTGFMLISRKALFALMQKHHDRLHFSLSTSDYGQPLWAIWDAQVHDRVFLTEDYNFCRLWQETGGKVYVDVAATFRHWGLHGYTGSLGQQYGFELSST